MGTPDTLQTTYVSNITGTDGMDVFKVYDRESKYDKLYFIEALYSSDSDGTNGIQNPIDSTDPNILPFYTNDSISDSSGTTKTVRGKMYDHLDALFTADVIEDAKFTSPTSLFTWFETSLKESCDEIASRKQGASFLDYSGWGSLEKEFYELYFKENRQAQNAYDAVFDLLENNYDNPQAYRPYIAWKFIDVMFPAIDRNNFFMIDRVHILMKFVFVLGTFHMESTGYDQKYDVFHNRVFTLLIKQSLFYKEFGGADDDNGQLTLEEMKEKNVLLSRKVRENSHVLNRNKETVQTTQDNLRTLVNVDSYIHSTRNMAWYFMVGLIVVLVLVSSAMAFSYSRGRNAEVYLVALIVILGVFSFEAFKGAEKVLSLPKSMYK